jgi:hypothetical protein
MSRVIYDIPCRKGKHNRTGSVAAQRRACHFTFYSLRARFSRFFATFSSTLATSLADSTVAMCRRGQVWVEVVPMWAQRAYQYIRRRPLDGVKVKDVR